MLDIIIERTVPPDEVIRQAVCYLALVQDRAVPPYAGPGSAT